MRVEDARQEEKMENTNDYITLKQVLRQAAQGDDPVADLGVATLHYYQALLSAVEDFLPCNECVNKIDLPHLRSEARQIRQETYASHQELQRACATRLREMGLLCASCQQHFQEHVLRIFAQRQADRQS